MSKIIQLKDPSNNENLYPVTYNNITVEDNLTSTSPDNALSANMGRSLKGLIDELDERDYIIAQGTSGIWTYEKWNSGTYKCWTRQSFSVSFGAWGNVYESKSSLKYSYPITFVSVQNAQYSIETSSRECWASCWTLGTTSVTPEVMVNSASSSNASGYINFYTIGKWK